MDGERKDWIATDLDGTLFGRERPAGAVPATWRKTEAGALPSSWMPEPRMRLFEQLARCFHVVPVTARDLESFQRVGIGAIPFRDGGVIANGAILLQPGSMEPDAEWDVALGAELEPWEEVLRDMGEILAGHSGGAAAPRLVSSNTGLPAYLVAKAHNGFWSEPEGLRARKHLEPFGCRVAELGRELQVLPPPVAKRRGLKEFARRYCGGTAPLIAFGDMPEDLGFMGEAEFIAMPRGSTLEARLIEAGR